MRVQARHLLVLSLAAALLLPGCGDDDGGGSSPELDELTASLDRAVDSTSRSEFRMRAYTEKEGRINLRAEMIATGDSTRGEMKGVYIQDGEAVPIRVRMHEDELWFTADGLGAVLPPGKRWVRSTDPELFSPTLTPAQFGEVLREAGSVENLGMKRIRGKRVKHLRAELDIAELADRVGGDAAERLEKLGAGAAMDLVVEIWVPPGERPLRFVVKADAAEPPEGEPRQFAEIEMDVLEYDVPVRVPAPPPEQVIEEKDAGL